MFTRREFLHASSLLSLSPILPTLLANTARAATAMADERVLVVVQLGGGNDGLNTVVPYADDLYAKARSTLRLKTEELHKLDDHVGLHPRMKAAKELFDDGRLSIVQNVGYPNPDRSHFRSMAIWQTATFDDARHQEYGWLGRALDTRAAKTGSADAVYVGPDQTPVALWGRRSSATSLATLDDLRLADDVKPASGGSSADSASLDQFVSAQVLSAYAAADQFAASQSKGRAAAQSNYPQTQLGKDLQLVAQLLKAGTRARVYYTAQAGYDTHSAQVYTHAQLLGELAGAIKAFLDDLAADGLDDRVLLLAFSEFGRRVAENDSKGTDHGAAAPVFLAGRTLRGGLVGSPPDLANLDAGDVKMQFDFRQVYATILGDWLAIDAQSVLGAKFEKLDLISI